MYCVCQELGVRFANIEEYPLELIPLDNDVMSLEMDSCFQVKLKLALFIKQQQQQL